MSNRPWYIPKHHITFSIWGTTMCSKCSINLMVNCVLPHPEGPLTMEENGCRHDGFILQNEDETGLNLFLYSKLSNVHRFIYTQTVFINVHHMQSKIIHNKKFIYKLYTQHYIYTVGNGFLVIL